MDYFLWRGGGITLNYDYIRLGNNRRVHLIATRFITSQIVLISFPNPHPLHPATNKCNHIIYPVQHIKSTINLIVTGKKHFPRSLLLSFGHISSLKNVNLINFPHHHRPIRLDMFMVLYLSALCGRLHGPALSSSQTGSHSHIVIQTEIFMYVCNNSIHYIFVLKFILFRFLFTYTQNSKCNINYI